MKVLDSNAGWHVARRVLVIACVLIPLAALSASALADILLPAYRLVFGWLAPEFRLLSLETGVEGAHRVLTARVTIADILVIGQHVIHPDARGVAATSTPLAHALHMPLTAMLIALALPRSAKHRALSMLAATAVTLPLLPFDLSAVLAANLWQLLIDQHNPGAVSPLLLWARFLEGGGRWLLGALIGVAACTWPALPKHPPRQ
jgi:hypothetical protein